MKQAARDFLEKLQPDMATKELRELLQTTLREYGFNDFVYAMVPSSKDGSLNEYVNITTLSDEWMKTYVNEELYLSDYALQHCVSRTEPLAWSDMFAARDAGHLNQEFSKTMTIAADEGLARGYTIPLEHFGLFHAGASIVVDPSASNEEVNGLFAEHRTEVMQVLEVFHSHLDRARTATEFYKLTPKEIETIEWLIDGKHVFQIADLMNLHISTVEKRLRVLRTKLRAASNPQLAAKAMSLNLIK